MKTPWTRRAAAEIELDWLMRAIEPAGEIARRDRSHRPVFGPGDEPAAQSAIAAVAAAAAAIEPDRIDAVRSALAATPDPAGPLARVALGEVLDDVALFEVARFIDGIERLRILWPEDPALPPLDPSLRARFAHGREDGGFYLSDAFDPRLGPARAALAAAGEALAAARVRLAGAVAQAAGLERVAAGEFILMRDRTPAVPPGVHVLRETPAYFVCELLLDEPGLEALARRDAASAAAAALEEEVRRDLCAAIGGHHEELLAARQAAGEIDALTARVRFAQRYESCVPEVRPGALLELEDARFLPLEERVLAARRRYAPISIALQGAAVVTGPNMGGKTAALRTCGFAAACAALGLPVPARRARLSLFRETAWLGLGAERGEERLLSSFGSEIVELREVLAGGAGGCLLLIDEFARTTTPAEGGALLIAVVGFASRAGACVLAATHLEAIARRGGFAHFTIAGPRWASEQQAQNAAGELPLEVALTRIGESMDYQLVVVSGDVSPGRDALALASLLGLEQTIVSDAWKLLE